MTSPTPIWKPWHDLQALYLGEIIVGRVSTSRAKRRDQASAIFNLAGVTAHWQTFRTEDQAKAFVESELANWLTKAGLT